MGPGRPAGNDQPDHAGKARGSGAPRPDGPQRVADPAVSQGARDQQRLPGAALHADAAAGTGGFAADFYGIFYHGVASTHIDALCHTWDEHAMWNGRDPKREITFDGATFGSVEHWREGIMTRA